MLVAHLPLSGSFKIIPWANISPTDRLDFKHEGIPCWSFGIEVLLSAVGASSLPAPAQPVFFLCVGFLSTLPAEFRSEL